MRVPTKDFINHFSMYTDAALTEPVFITKNGRPRVVLVSTSTLYYLLDAAGDKGKAIRETLSPEDRFPLPSPNGGAGRTQG